MSNEDTSRTSLLIGIVLFVLITVFGASEGKPASPESQPATSVALTSN